LHVLLPHSFKAFSLSYFPFIWQLHLRGFIPTDLLVIPFLWLHPLKLFSMSFSPSIIGFIPCPSLYHYFFHFLFFPSILLPHFLHFFISIPGRQPGELTLKSIGRHHQPQYRRRAFSFTTSAAVGGWLVHRPA
jgi:hypothetical protein